MQKTNNKDALLKALLLKQLLSNAMNNKQQAGLNTAAPVKEPSTNTNNINSLKTHANNMTEAIVNPASVIDAKSPTASVFEEFSLSEPEFFTTRIQLFDYLSQNASNFDLSELKKIAELTKTLEDEAIKRFCKTNPKYAQFLQEENSKVTKRLQSANSALEGQSKQVTNFSEADILKMSNSDFLKNESAINAQIQEMIKNRG